MNVGQYYANQIKKEELNGAIEELFIDTLGDYQCGGIYRNTCCPLTKTGQPREHGHLRCLF
jgi:hypothetical protein